MSRKATGVETFAIVLILVGLMYLITGIGGVIFDYINGSGNMAAFLMLLFPISLIVGGWGLTKLKYWAWVCAIALIVIGIIRTAYDLIIYGAWQDILGVAALIVILVYFLTAKTRSQFTWR
ncbi:MAG: hypothetical protein GQ580_00260 [Candidatus Thorarchaeota archaeon]|nr:hypothetical protein [Candidatus Thorarchaeota archaeon]